MMHVMVVAIPLSPPNLQSRNQVLEKRSDGGNIFSEKLFKPRSTGCLKKSVRLKIKT